MSFYKDIELTDCPYCGGPGLLQEENGSWYVMCLDCGSETAPIDFVPDREAAEKAADLWNHGKVVRMGISE